MAKRENKDPRQIILDRLKELEWSRYQLAEACYAKGEISRTPIYEFLAGKRDVLVSVYFVMCDVLGLRVEVDPKVEPTPGTQARNL